MSYQLRGVLAVFWGLSAAALFAAIFYTPSVAVLVPASLLSAYLAYSANSAAKRRQVVTFLVAVTAYFSLGVWVSLGAYAGHGMSEAMPAVHLMVLTSAYAFLCIILALYALYDLRGRNEAV